MARNRNVLKEIKGFGARAKTTTKKHKTKQPSQQQSKTPPALHPLPIKEQWQAFQCLGNCNNPANWHQTWEGDFHECFMVVENSINLQIDEIVNQDGAVDEIWEKYAEDMDTLNQKMDELYLPPIQAIKQECLQSGGCQGQGWTLTLNSETAEFGLHQAKGIFTHSDSWAGWEQVGENASDPKSWRLVINDNLEKCLEGMMFFVTVEIEYATDNQLTDDMYIGDFFIYQNRLRSKLVEEIKRVCAIKGEYRGGGWAISSVKTQEDCWAIVRSKAKNSS